MKFVRFSVLLLMAINLLNLNWLQAEDKEASPFVWVDKAAEAYRAGKVKEAVQFADRAVAAEPKNPRLHFFKGQLHNALREYDKSITAYTKALALKPPAPLLPICIRNAVRRISRPPRLRNLLPTLMLI